MPTIYKISFCFSSASGRTKENHRLIAALPQYLASRDEPPFDGGKIGD